MAIAVTINPGSMSTASTMRRSTCSVGRRSPGSSREGYTSGPTSGASASCSWESPAAFRAVGQNGVEDRGALLAARGYHCGLRSSAPIAESNAATARRIVTRSSSTSIETWSTSPGSMRSVKDRAVPANGKGGHA